MKKQQMIRLSLAVLASVVSMFLSWPYWRNFEYWPESRSMWLVYFVLGFVLAVYVCYVFLGGLRTLFEHDAIERQAIESAAASNKPTDAVTPEKERQS